MLARKVFKGMLVLTLFGAPRTVLPALPPRSETARSHLGAGLELFNLERHSEAAREFELALEIDPKLDDARYHLGVSYFKLRRYQDSRRQFERLLPTGYRKDWLVYYLGRLDLLEGNFNGAIARFESLEKPQPLEDELYYLGSALMKQGEPEKAVEPLRRQLRFNPRDFRAHNLLARAYARTGRPAGAEREYAAAAQLHEYYLNGKAELMECRRQLEIGQSDQAWASCGGVLKTDDIDKLVGVGMLFGEFGSYERALQLFGKALELDPESPEVNYDLGFTYFQEKDYPRARKYLEPALQLRPNFFEALALEGTILYLQREDTAAVKTLRRAHELHPGDSAITKLLATLEGSEN